MSLSISISTKDTATPALQQQMARLSPRRLNAAIGPRLVRLFQRHFLALGPNKRGWPTTNFWPRAAKATTWQSSGDAIVITVNQTGVRQRLLGGPISPVNKGALTTPIDPAAYGKTAADFPGIFLMKTKDKGAFLVTGTEATGYKFLFKLSGGVTQVPDPTVLPTQAEIMAEATAAINEAAK